MDSRFKNIIIAHDLTKKKETIAENWFRKQNRKPLWIRRGNGYMWSGAHQAR